MSECESMCTCGGIVGVGGDCVGVCGACCGQMRFPLVAYLYVVLSICACVHFPSIYPSSIPATSASKSGGELGEASCIMLVLKAVPNTLKNVCIVAETGCEALLM